MLKGFAHLLDIDPGFDPVAILTLQTTVSNARYPERHVGARHSSSRCCSAVESVPGVEAAGYINLIPYVTNGGWNGNIRYEGHQADDQTKLPLVEYRVATPSLFAVTKQRLIAAAGC